MTPDKLRAYHPAVIGATVLKNWAWLLPYYGATITAPRLCCDALHSSPAGFLSTFVHVSLSSYHTVKVRLIEQAVGFWKANSIAK